MVAMAPAPQAAAKAVQATPSVVMNPRRVMSPAGLTAVAPGAAAGGAGAGGRMAAGAAAAGAGAPAAPVGCCAAGRGAVPAPGRSGPCDAGWSAGVLLMSSVKARPCS
ncbi:MAG: hypothetical protein DMF51_10990 [Acidobacteria bacterium]|nr:MAG: hypothetical protein DMF51_10990 [Acidobacteriota bacterium]